MADSYAEYQQTVREQEIVEESIREFSELQGYRATLGMQWEEAASLAMPSQRNTFFYGSYNFPGIKKTQLQVDSSAMLANWKFAAICDSMMTPFSSQWHRLQADNPYVQKNRGVRLWFEQADHILSAMRYNPTSGFRRNNSAIYQLVGVFGNGPMFVDQLCDMRGKLARGIRYKAVPVGQVYIKTNHQGRVSGFCRFYRMTAGQAMTAFPGKLPEQIVKAAEKNAQAPFDFLHRVCPNMEYEPGRLGPRGKIFASYNIALTGKKLLSEEGYNSFPMPYCRYTENPDDDYGRGWCMDVLPTLKTLNAQKTVFLKQGHRAADPVLLGADDGTINMSLRPGAYNPGTMSADGKRLVDILPSGDIQISKEMMDEEKSIIGEASLSTIFAALVDNPNMTATQVVELINQKGIFLAPMAGSMAPDYLGMLIERELDLAMQLRILPPMPPLLKEAKGEYKVVYTSPLFKAARAGDAAGFLRTVESALQVASQTQDPSHMDPFAFKRAWPAIADIQSVPESWMASPEEMLAAAKQRADDKAKEQQIQAMPAQAAMLKAQAKVNEKTGSPMPQGIAQAA